ncbi:MAG: Gfo/Idh/MocA family protein, partial [Thermoprotei archaeon]
RYNPELQAAKKFVDSGFLGKPYYAEAAGGEVGARRRGIPGETFTKLETAGGGVTLDIGVYVLDNALYLLGHPNPVSVSGFTYAAIGKDESAAGVGAPTWAGYWYPKNFEVEDFSAAFIRFENDLTMVYKQAWAMHAESLGNPILLGTKGGITMNPLTLYTDMNGYMVNITPVHLPQRQGPWFYQKVLDFLTAIRDGTKPSIDTKGIVKMHYIIDAIFESSRTKSEVKVRLPEDIK